MRELHPAPRSGSGAVLLKPVAPFCTHSSSAALNFGAVQAHSCWQSGEQAETVRGTDPAPRGKEAAMGEQGAARNASPVRA